MKYDYDMHLCVLLKVNCGTCVLKVYNDCGSHVTHFRLLFLKGCFDIFQLFIALYSLLVSNSRPHCNSSQDTLFN